MLSLYCHIIIYCIRILPIYYDVCQSYTKHILFHIPIWFPWYFDVSNVPTSHPSQPGRASDSCLPPSVDLRCERWHLAADSSNHPRPRWSWPHQKGISRKCLGKPMENPWKWLEIAGGFWRKMCDQMWSGIIHPKWRFSHGKKWSL